MTVIKGIFPGDIKVKAIKCQVYIQRGKRDDLLREYMVGTRGAGNHQVSFCFQVTMTHKTRVPYKKSIALLGLPYNEYTESVVGYGNYIVIGNLGDGAKMRRVNYITLKRSLALCAF